MKKPYPELVSAILSEVDTALRSVSPQSLAAFQSAILDTNRIFLAGRGRSGLHMRAFAMRLMHLGLNAYVVDDVTTPAVAASDLLVVGSGSGGTPSLVQYAMKAKTLGVRIVAITGVRESPIAQQADSVVYIAAPSQKAEGSSTGVSAQPMANLFEQSLGLLLDITTIQLMDELGLTGEQMFARHANLE